MILPIRRPLFCQLLEERCRNYALVPANLYLSVPAKCVTIGIRMLFTVVGRRFSPSARRFKRRVSELAKRIYVGNLPYEATEDEVRDLFADYGEVESVIMINDRETGRFRGFCFVEMGNADADKAIEALDGAEVDGRPIKVNEARPREERGGRRGGGGGGRGKRGSRDRRGSRDSDFPDSGGRTRR